MIRNICNTTTGSHVSELDYVVVRKGLQFSRYYCIFIIMLCHSILWSRRSKGNV